MQARRVVQRTGANFSTASRTTPRKGGRLEQDLVPRNPNRFVANRMPNPCSTQTGSNLWSREPGVWHALRLAASVRYFSSVESSPAWMASLLPSICAMFHFAALVCDVAAHVCALLRSLSQGQLTQVLICHQSDSGWIFRGNFVQRLASGESALERRCLQPIAVRSGVL